MPHEGSPVRDAVIGEKPIVEENPRRVGSVGIAVLPPRLDRVSERGYTGSCSELRRHIEEILLAAPATRRAPAPSRHQLTSTSTAFVVSFPRMSMALTRIV